MLKFRQFIARFGVAFTMMLLASCARSADRSVVQNDGNAAPTNVEALHNVIPVTDNLISGSVPESHAGFDELKAMGIRTIISVDGADPDVGRARARGMRYVHIPIGYHGISRHEQLTLAKAVAELEGPVFLHCHHGKHRGPAAAAVAAVVLGDLAPEEGVSLLEKAGTAPSYPGLFACVRGASIADEATLRAFPAEFPEIAPTPGYVKAMAEAQIRCDHLVQIKDAGWRTPPHNPDPMPMAEAARLENLMRALIDDPEVDAHPEDFETMMRDSARLCQEFETALASKAPGSELAQRLQAVKASCTACHVKYRNVR